MGCGFECFGKDMAKFSSYSHDWRILTFRSVAYYMYGMCERMLV